MPVDLSKLEEDVVRQFADGPAGGDWTRLRQSGPSEADASGAVSRRKARRIAYREGQAAVPSRFSRALFDIEILDTVTGKLVPAGWAEREAVARNRAELTVGEVGYW